MKTVQIPMNLTEEEANFFALWVKRIGWDEFRNFAKNEDEAYEIRAAVEAVERQFNEAGFRPR